MANFIKEITPTARKEYYCELCGGKINKGEKYIRQTYSDGGTAYTTKSHIHCSNLCELLKMYDEYGDDLTNNDFEGCVDEYVRNKHYSKTEPDKFGYIWHRDPKWNLNFDEVVKKVYDEVSSKKD